MPKATFFSSYDDANGEEVGTIELTGGKLVWNLPPDFEAIVRDAKVPDPASLPAGKGKPVKIADPDKDPEAFLKGCPWTFNGAMLSARYDP